MISIDLHSHTTASDGTLSPLQLCERAVERGVDTLAITDHDTVAAHFFLRDFLRDNKLSGDLRLITGIELSTSWSGAEIHIVGLDFPLDHPNLQPIMSNQGKSRRKRSLHISQRLARRLPAYSAEQIFEAVLAGAIASQKASPDGFNLPDDQIQIGRPHFARWLVSIGLCKDMEDAFQKYLGNNKIGNLKAFWPPMSQGAAWIRALGGIPVLAHPGKYKMTRTRLRALLKDFKLAGGQAVEVQGSNQPHSQVEQMAGFCREFGFHGSRGSDFHNPDYPWVDIGRLPSTMPANVKPVWELFREPFGEIEKTDQ